MVAESPPYYTRDTLQVRPCKLDTGIPAGDGPGCNTLALLPPEQNTKLKIH